MDKIKTENIIFDEFQKKLKNKDIIPTNIAAKRMNVSVSTILRWIREGKLSAYKVMGRYYVETKNFRKIIVEIRNCND